MSERNLVLTAQAERVLLEIERLQDALDAGALVVTGSTGQPVPNKLLAELRSHRWLLCRLLMEVTPPAVAAVDEIDVLRREWESAGVP